VLSTPLLSLKFLGQALRFLEVLPASAAYRGVDSNPDILEVFQKCFLVLRKDVKEAVQSPH